MKLINKISEIAESLKEKYPKLSDFEALQISVIIQQNDLLIDAFVLNRKEPSALEAIAIQMGFSREPFSQTITESLSKISENLEKLKE